MATLTHFMVVDEDKHREDEYEIFVSLPEAIKIAQKRLNDYQSYYTNPEVEVRQLDGKEGCWWIAEAQCGSFTITVYEVEVPVSGT